jgi:signal transduction histidine kinase/DNA-binding response OmpR family regulator
MLTLLPQEPTYRQTPAMPDDDKVNILVVDDMPEKVLVLESILVELDQNIVTARSGEEALRRVLEHDFAVILLDVKMPGMDGLETAAYIRRRKKSEHTPIIFITGFADEVHTARGYSLGAVDYILSPVVPEILRTKVKVFVDLFRMTQQVRRQAEARIALAREQAARAVAEEATRRSTFLAEASIALSSSLDFQATLRQLARHVVPFLADLGAVTRTDEQHHAGPTEVAWEDAEGALHTHTAASLDRLPPLLGEAIHRVLVSGKSELLTNLGGWTPEPDEGAATSRPGFVLASVFLLPLLARGRTLGALTLALGPSGRHHRPNDRALAEDLADRAAVALDNARLYENIQEADRRKNEFLAMLSHELRNPLAPIRNAVEILQRFDLKERPLLLARDMIDRQVTHMARLIDDLLDMSRLSRGKILLRKERVDLVQIVRATIEDYRSLLEGTGLKLQARLPDQSFFTEGDPTRLAQIVGNVLHNANKFTDTGGNVMVHLETDRDGSTATLTIRDTGIGMDQTMLPQVFETFSQADRSLDRSRGGLGLGLALVKGLVELHGGTVQVSSEGLGKGTEIVIRLPLLPSSEPARRDSVSDANGSAGAKRVLVIEDNADAAESLRVLLTLAGHQVEVAFHGHAGVEVARTFKPEVVLCDIGLPGGMDGYSVARALRQDTELASALLIATTGYGQEEDQRLCREAGFDVHLTKPVDFAELQKLLAPLPP